MKGKPQLSREVIDFFTEIKEYIDIKVEEKIHKNPHKGHRNDRRAIERECTEEVFHGLEDSLATVLENITNFHNYVREEDPKLFEKILKHFKTDIKSMKDTKNFNEIVEQGKKHKVSPEILDKVYDIGARFCADRELEMAFLCFNWLCVFDAKNPKNWYMKGIVEQNLEKYTDALASYYQVISINPDYIHVYTQLLNCLILMGDIDTARKVYDAFTHGVPHKNYADDQGFCENLRWIKKILS